MERERLEKRWFELTREILPALANDRAWPIRFDHCFQRVLLDHAVGGFWRDAIDPPAYRNADDDTLARAIGIGEDAVAGKRDMTALNRQSLVWRGKAS